MGYLHIENLYKPSAQKVLEFKKVFAMEKIHGTSAHVRWRKVDPDKPGEVTFFSGGAKYEQFAQIFNIKDLAEKFEARGINNVTVYGEAYGGNMQSMSLVYGPTLKFIAFDVYLKHEEAEHPFWLSVPKAEAFTLQLGLEFVSYVECSSDLEVLDAQRDAFSVQALRNGMGEHPREGIVIRPPYEVLLNNGERVIAKHKTTAYQERKRQPKVGEKPEVLAEAETIAEEWVTENRLAHVIDHLKGEGVNVNDLASTSRVIKAMKEDIIREANGEVILSDEAFKVIGRKTALMFKKNVVNALYVAY